MMNYRSVAVLLTAATLIAAPDFAAAQPAKQGTPASAEAAKRADELVQKASRLYAGGKYQEAEALLLQAWEQNPSFDVAYNLGNTAFQMKKHREAAEYLSYALKHWPLMKAAAKLRPTAEQRFAASRAQVGALVVSADVAGAEVLVDGRAVGKAPLEGEVFVEPGEHEVEARLGGYVPAKQTVKVVKGSTAEVALALVPVQHESAEAGPGAAGGQGAPGLAAGAPLADGQPGGPVTPAPPPRSWVPVIALGAASVVGLGVGVGLTVASRSARDDADLQRASILSSGPGCVNAPSDVASACGAFEDATSSAGALGTGAIVAYTVSGALAAGALVYALWPRSSSMSGSVGVRPTAHVAKDGAILIVDGAW